MLYFPERMWKGDVPNVDFLHLYGPGALHVLMGWYKVFGETLFAERTFGLLQHVGIIFGLFALARPWGRTAAAAVASLSVFYILTPIGLTAMAWNGGLALTLWSAVFVLRGLHVAEGRHRHVCWLVAGILAGLALTYRPDLAIALGLVFGWLAITRPDSRADIAVGAVAGLLPMWIHLAIAGPAASFRGMFLDPVFELRAGRELPRPPSWDRLDGALQKIAEFVPPWWELPHLSVPNGIFLWFFAMLILTALLLAFAAVAAPHGRRRSEHRAARRRARVARDPAAGPPAPGLDAPHVGDVHLVAVPDRRRGRGRAPTGVAHDAAGRTAGRRRVRRSP